MNQWMKSLHSGDDVWGIADNWGVILGLTASCKLRVCGKFIPKSITSGEN